MFLNVFLRGYFSLPKIHTNPKSKLAVSLVPVFLVIERNANPKLRKNRNCIIIQSVAVRIDKRITQHTAEI